MSAAQGPHCEGGCNKRLSKRYVTACPWCGRFLCLKCLCPAKCYETFAPPTPSPTQGR